VAAAEAVWKVGQRRDLALPFLIYALKDEYWGVALQASQVLGEMGGSASEAIVDLIELADRRLSKGPFSFERGERDSRPLLAVVATAIGQCGLGLKRPREVSDVLRRIATSAESEVRSAALVAVTKVETADLSQ
jgi:HEAT repeat protein